MKSQEEIRLPAIPYSLLEHKICSPLVHICSKCKLQFQNSTDLYEHASNSSLDSESTKSIEPETVSKSEQHTLEIKLPYPIIPDDEQTRVFVCSMCQATFKKYKGMRQHIGKVHMTQDSQCVCSECGKMYKHKYALKFHRIQVHERATRVSCPYCDKTLYNKYMLNRHIDKNH